MIDISELDNYLNALIAKAQSDLDKVDVASSRLHNMRQSIYNFRSLLDDVHADKVGLLRHLQEHLDLSEIGPSEELPRLYHNVREQVRQMREQGYYANAAE